VGSESKPLESLYDVSRGDDVLRIPELAALYGPLRFPRDHDGPHVIANFVSTLDGVVSRGAGDETGGGMISGFDEGDRMVMGLLRAAADCIVVGAGNLRSVPGHVWTAPHVYPALAGSHQSLREALGKPGPPLNVIVTARGELDPSMRVLRTEEVPVLIVTSPRGSTRIRSLGLPRSVQVSTVDTANRLTARSILDAIARVRSSDVLLVEGGPRLLGGFFAESCLDEQFLTLAPQVAGRDASGDRPGLVSGRTFAPERPLWGELVSVKRGGSHLFLRHAFPARTDEPPRAK
jgi:riboflavin biosynthesis pyrimidine reductase